MVFTFRPEFCYFERLTEDVSASPWLLCRRPPWTCSPRRRTPGNSMRSWQRAPGEPSRTSSRWWLEDPPSTPGVPFTYDRDEALLIHFCICLTLGDHSSCRLHKHRGQVWYSGRWWRGWRSWWGSSSYLSPKHCLHVLTDSVSFNSPFFQPRRSLGGLLRISE